MSSILRNLPGWRFLCYKRGHLVALIDFTIRGLNLVLYRDVSSWKLEDGAVQPASYITHTC